MVDVTELVISFVHQYGYLAIFVYMMLETAFILHFAPSELVIPVAASVLVTGPVTFVLFVLVTTLGATGGALIPYVVFRRYGVEGIERYGTYIHVSSTDLDRSQSWFQRWGESSVFWGRLVPLLRALVSIPAGLSRMDGRRFVLYSAAGSLVFNATFTYLAAGNGNGGSPFGVLAAWLVANVPVFAYASENTLRVALQVALLLAIGTVIWRRREWISAHPERARSVAARTILWVGVTAGLVLLTTGVSLPQEAFPYVTWLWNDPVVFLELGLSETLALVVSGLALVVLGIGGFVVVRQVPVAWLVRVSHRLSEP